jgi:Ca2+-binding EF-hand superfamily protein
LDKNSDSFLSQEEAGQHPMLMRNFDAIDANKDGKLAADEIQAAHKAMHEQMKQAAEARFKEADQDGDGALSPSETETITLAQIAKYFDVVDANKDGKLTKEEVQATRKSMHGHGRGQGQSEHQAKMDAQFNAADKDGDGALTVQEAQASGRDLAAKKFERLDANKDGKLDREELRAGMHHRSAGS